MLNRQTILDTAQRLIDNNLIPAAENILKDNGIKASIRNGKIIEQDDVTEQFLDKFITNHKEMLSLKDDIRKLSRTDDEVLIIGPTGTGKEILANALHGKREGKFQTCNAAGLPEHLIESELFGHVRGAFTGAMTDKIGLVMKAKGGTFFLDEVGDLPLAAQTKLLRTIQEKEIRKVGGSDDETITCRFVFATNKDIRKMVDQGLFRLDLYARISTFELRTLPLHERLDDQQLIIQSIEHGKEFLIAYNNRPQPYENLNTDFNVRSLQQHIKRFKVLGKLPV